MTKSGEDTLPTATPRILLLGDYSNFHACLGEALRAKGCEVTVMSDGSTFMDCKRDLDISRTPGKLGGLKLFARLLGPLHSKMKGYDIVSLRDPNFLDLRPQRSRFFFNRLRRDNKAIFLTALTTDVPFLDMLAATDSPLAYSEWFVNGQPNRLMIQDHAQWESWHSPEMTRLNSEVYSGIDGAVSALYEYHLSLQRVLPEEKIAYGGIPVNVEDIHFIDRAAPKKVRVFLGRDRRRLLIKGTDLLEEAVRRLEIKYPDKVELVLVENVSREHFFNVMHSCHIVLDQIYSYTPATTALEAMAAGLTVVTGAEPEFYRFIGENNSFPAVNAPIELEALTSAIEQLVLHPAALSDRGRIGREFVKRHNDAPVVADRFLNFWLQRLNEIQSVKTSCKK